MSASDIVKRQKADAVYNIDCYAVGLSRMDGTTQVLADEEAAFNSQRAIKLVRNILMAAENTYLQLRGLVWSRWPQAIIAFQAEQQNREMQKVLATRIQFGVSFNEFSPQIDPVELKEVAVDIQRDSDGAVLAQTKYIY